MNFFKHFRRKKDEKDEKELAFSTGAKEAKKPTELQEICGADKEVYEALYEFLFLEPEKFGKEETADRFIEKAKEAGNETQAAVNWRIAGGLALYEGDLEKVRLCFSQYQTLTGKKLKILEIPERVLEYSKKYYERKKR